MVLLFRQGELANQDLEEPDGTWLDFGVVLPAVRFRKARCFASLSLLKGISLPFPAGL